MEESTFEYVKEKAESLYESIGSVHCPYFDEEVFFNAKGIRHLKFKTERKMRQKEDQYARLKLLHLAPQVLKLSRTVQGIWYTKGFEPKDIHNREDNVLQNICFYEFIAVLDELRIKVIVKQIEKGEKYFWSIIPFWKGRTASHKED